MDVFLPCVTICNDWTKIVNIWHLLSSLRRSAHPGVIMFLVVQLLGFEDPLHLIWYGGIWVVATAGVISTQKLVDERTLLTQDPDRHH